MKFSRYWLILFFIPLFFITTVESISEIKNENNNSDFILPEEFPYKIAIQHFKQKSMVGWYNMVNGFLSAVHSKTIETVDFFMKYFKEKQFVIPDSIYELLKLQYAVIACIVIGLLYVVIMWITGLIFFCCRCCGNCGGKRLQLETSKTSLWRKVLIFFLVILTILLLIAVICMFVTNNSIKTSYSVVENNSDNIFEDIESILINTRNQINYIVSCIQVTLKNVFFELNNIEDFLKKNIKSEMTQLYNLIDLTNKAILGALNLSTSLNHIYDDSFIILNTKDNVNNSLMHIKENLTELNNKCSKCKEEINPDQFEIKNLEFENDFINDTVNMFNELKKEDYKSSLENITKSIEELPQYINEKTESIQKEIKSGLNELSTKIQNSSILKEIENIFPEAIKRVNKSHIIAKKYIITGNKYYKYGSYTSLGICIIMAIIISCLVIGLFFGICGYQSNRQPTKRTAMSNIGGHFLLISVTWMFIFSGFFMLLTTLLFVIGGSVEAYFCQPLSDDKFIMINKIMQTILNKSNFSSEMSFIADVMPSDILRKCNSNETIFKILNLEKRLNLSEMLDFEKNLNLDEQLKKLQKINFPKMKILNTKITDFLNKLKTELKLENIERNLEKFDQNVVFDIDTQKKNLKMLENSQSDYKNNIKDILFNIEVMEEKLNNFTKIKNQLKQKLIKIVEQGKQTLKRLEEIIKNIQTEDKNFDKILEELILKITKHYIKKLLMHGEKLTDFIKKSLNESIAPCQPIWNIIASVKILICEYNVQILNGFWFALGWCLFCFIPTIIVATKLSKHFLKMKYKTLTNKEEKNEYDLELSPRNKVRPDNGCYPPVHHM